LGLVAAFGALGAGTARGADVPAACASGEAGGNKSLTITSSGIRREAVLHVPRTDAGRPLALIVALHGSGSDGRRFARDSGLSTLADQDKFAVVYPSSLGAKWAISGRERDVRFGADLLDRVESVTCIDQRRVYAAGISSGAGMAARLACELSARIAAIVLVSGGYKSLPACTPDRPVSVLEIHGTSDPTVPYRGTGPSHAGAVLPYVAGWASRDRCAATPAKRVVAAHTLRYDWKGCAGGTVVEHLRIYGGRHGLPNADGAEISSGARSPISGARNIWHFLASRVLQSPFAGPSPPPPAVPSIPSA
jgi:polyhydroxybutyrate depolymerase